MFCPYVCVWGGGGVHLCHCFLGFFSSFRSTNNITVASKHDEIHNTVNFVCFLDDPGVGGVCGCPELPQPTRPLRGSLSAHPVAGCHPQPLAPPQHRAPPVHAEQHHPQVGAQGQQLQLPPARQARGPASPALAERPGEL